MLTFTTGNLLESSADAVVNTVNCVGVMGKGLALQVKQSYPAVFKRYAADCKKGLVQLGRVHIVDRQSLEPPFFIINFPTKGHWKARSNFEDIRLGLKSLRQTLSDFKIKSIALPPLGCGLGGLDWANVKALIETELAGLDGVNIFVFEPSSPNGGKS